MNKTLIDNSSEQLSMVHAIKACITTSGINHIRIATGYWDLLGTAEVITELKHFMEREGTIIQLLIGKDPYIYSSQLKDASYEGCTRDKEYIHRDLMKLDVKDEYVDTVDFLRKYCDGEKPRFEVHHFKDEDNHFLHSKCFIFTNDMSDEVAYGIIGSSNFTKKGITTEGNSELNYLENDAATIWYKTPEGMQSSRRGHVAWFEEKWDTSEPWNKVFLEEILKGTPVHNASVEREKEKEEDKPLTPYDLYIKLLQYNFGDIVDANISRKVESYLPKTYRAYQYQTDAVTQCYNIMQKYDGFMLADVVGLGKTVVGTMLIKHFLSVPDKDDRQREVLIICPPAIKQGWVDTIADFDKDRDDTISKHIQIVTTGSISKVFEGDDSDYDIEDSGDFSSAIPKKDFGLILVDESHKFRNNGTTMYKELDSLIRNISINGPQPYVGLLSATPQNNRPEDLQNQIYLFSRSHTASKFEGIACNLESYFAEIKRRYKAIKDLSPEEQAVEVKQISFDIRKNILDQILVRRTRTDVKGYKDENGNPILKFPKVAAPKPLPYEFTPALSKLFHETMNFIMFEEDSPSSIGYYRYRAIQYFNNQEYKDRYRGKGSLDSDRIANQLANIMKMLLVKRLESSFYAFKKSLGKLCDDTELMLDMLDKGTVFICPANQIDVSIELSDTTKSWEDRANNIRRKIKELTDKGLNPKGSNAEYKTSDFTDDFKDKLKHDRDVLKRLYNSWKDVDDPKRKAFRKELRKILPETEPNKKLVIFTESADTLKDLTKLVNEEDHSVLSITAENRNKKQQEIRENFDANYKGNKKDDYQVIISTDVLAEGINLHRAYTIINYDTPWNSTKLMQRIGRVNRIGSVADEVLVYNFMPSSEGDSVINLFNRAHTKLQSFHSTFGEDAQVYTEDEEVSHFDVTVQDLEEQESPLMKYLFELRDYKQKYPSRYEYLESIDDCIEMAVHSERQESLYLMKTEKTNGMYIKLEGISDTILSKEQMFSIFSSVKDLEVEELPENTMELRMIAEYVFDAENKRITLNRSQKQKDNAIDILHRITTIYKNLSTDTIKLLRRVRKVVDDSNTDMCYLIAKVGKELNIFNDAALSLSDDKIEQYLSEQFANIDNIILESHRKPQMLIALYK